MATSATEEELLAIENLSVPETEAIFAALDRDWAALPPGPKHDAAVSATEKVKTVLRGYYTRQRMGQQ